VTPPAQLILAGGDTPGRYREKRFWQSLHRPVCSALPALCGSNTAVYRSAADGSWHLRGGGGSTPLSVTDGKPGNFDRWPEYTRIAEAFVSKLPVARECVVFTIVPSVDTRRAEAESIAAALRLELIAPQVDGLRTFDGSHLDSPSAERWSAAFLDAAGDRIRRCLSR
jgi:hypothetical protein